MTNKEQLNIQCNLPEDPVVRDKVQEVLEELKWMKTSKVVDAHDSAIQKYECGTYIYRMEELNDYFAGVSPLDIVQSINHLHFKPEDEFFWADPTDEGKLHSGTYWLWSNIQNYYMTDLPIIPAIVARYLAEEALSDDIPF